MWLANEICGISVSLHPADKIVKINRSDGTNIIIIMETTWSIQIVGDEIRPSEGNISYLEASEDSAVNSSGRLLTRQSRDIL